jgi:hypothetical protein
LLTRASLPGLGNPGAAENRIAWMLPFAAGSGQILLGTRSGRLFLQDGAGLRPFATDAGPLMSKTGTYSAAMLQDGGVGIATTLGGFLILERDGRIRRYLDRSAGVPSEGVLSVFVDPAGTVWLGLQNGIARVEVSSPLSEFPAAAGMSAAVVDIRRHQGVLYAATVAGMKMLDGRTGQFRSVPGLESISSFGLLSDGNSLLVAGARDGVFQLTGTTVRKILGFQSGNGGDFLAQSRQDPNRVWIGTIDGLASMRQDPSGRWVDEGTVAAMPDVRSIVEPEPGLLWLGTLSRGVERVRLAGGSLQNAKVEHFGKADGLPTDGGVSVHLAAGRVIFACPEGVREFDAASGRFVDSKIFGGMPT